MIKRPRATDVRDWIRGVRTSQDQRHDPILDVLIDGAMQGVDLPVTDEAITRVRSPWGEGQRRVVARMAATWIRNHPGSRGAKRSAAALEREIEAVTGRRIR